MIYSPEICQFINSPAIDHDKIPIKPDLLITVRPTIPNILINHPIIYPHFPESVRKAIYLTIGS